MRIIYVIFAVVLTVGIAMRDVSGAVYTVSPGGRIAAAIDPAQNGDTVLINDGQYSETIIPYGKTLTIGSMFLLDGDSSHIAATVIVPDFGRPDTGSCVVYAYGESIEGRLVGLTLTGGTGTFWTYGDTTAGGGIFIYHSGVQVENCIIRECRAWDGGGVGTAWDYPPGSAQSKVTLRNCEISHCRASYAGGGGYISACSLSVTGCLFDADTAAEWNGGLAAEEWWAVVDSSTFRHCFSAMNGGMGYFSPAGRISNCLFNHNGSHQSFAQGYGAQLWYQSGIAPVTRCIFRNSISAGLPIVLWDETGYAMRFVGNVIENNVVTETTGIILVSNGWGEIGYNVIRNNFVFAGSIYCVQDCHVRIHHNYLVGNRAHDSQYASVIAIVSNAQPRVDSNLFVGNSGNSISYQEPAWANFTFQNNWWGDASGPYHPTLNPSGRGDTILQDHIQFGTWLTTPPDTSLPSLAAGEPHRSNPVSTWELVEAYPNPFNGEIRIVIAGFAGADFRLTLHNLLGEEVTTVCSGAITGNAIAYKAPSSLASGVYFLRAADGKAVQSKKIVLLK
jgi:hypothetical protein